MSIVPKYMQDPSASEIITTLRSVPTYSTWMEILAYEKRLRVRVWSG